MSWGSVIRRVGFRAGMVVATAALMIPPIPASGTAGFGFHRFAGDNRFDTARAIATEFGASNALVIARADVFADAMTGTYIAGVLAAPVLLVRSDGIPAETDQAIRASGARRAVIVGSTAAVSTSVEVGLRARGLTVERIGGPTRYDTALQAAQFANPAGIGVLDGLRTAILVSGLNFPDALSGGPLSFARKFPILLTSPNSLTPQVSSAVEALGIGHVLVLGGTSAVSSAVDAALRARGVVVTRVAGANRSATSVEVARLAIRRLAFSDRHVNIARGDDFPDALALAPHAGRDRDGSATGQQPAPVELTLSPTFAGPELMEDLRGRAVTLQDGHIAGGFSAVSRELEEELRVAASSGVARIALEFSSAAPGGSVAGTVTGEGIGAVTVTGCGLSAQSVRSGAGAFTLNIPATQSEGDCLLTFSSAFTNGRASETDVLSLTIRRPVGAAPPSYGVTGPPATSQAVDTDRSCSVSVPTGAVVDLRLLPTSGIVTSSGTPTFTDLNNDHIADEPSMSADIVSVNGSPVAPADEVNDVTAGTGTLSVVLRSAQPEDVTLVVWTDQAGLATNGLDLSAASGTNKPARETAGVGCRSAFASAATVGTSFGPAPVAGIDKAADSVGAGGTTMVYDANDTFVIDGVVQPAGAGGMAAFESRLSPGDSLSGSYVADRNGVSTFSLNDVAPAAPSSLHASADGTTIMLSLTESATSTADSYNLYRSVRTGSNCPDFVASRSAYGSAIRSLTDPTPNQVGSAVLSASDPGLESGTTYCYAVTTMDDGDESNSAAQASATTAGTPPATTTTTVAAGTTTTSTSSTTTPSTSSSTTSTSTSTTSTTTTTTTTTTTIGPFVRDARAQEVGGGLVGTVDGEDLLQFISSDPLSPSIDDSGSTVRVHDSDGTAADVTCGANASCLLIDSGRYETDTGPADVPAGHLLRVTMSTSPTTIAGSPGDIAGLQYPLTVDAVDARWATSDSRPINLSSSDRTIDRSTIGVHITGATGFAGADPATADKIFVTYSGPVTCAAARPGQFLYRDATNSFVPVAATSIACSGSQVTLTFPSTAIEAGDVGDTTARVAYSQSSEGPSRVKAQGSQVEAVAPEGQPVTVEP